MFLPTTIEEFKQLGWQQADILLITGDSYIDSPFIGAAVIGKTLTQAGFRVGIIAQPDINSPNDITRLGEPRLFWGVTGGSVDSMVANYTASRKKRRSDDYTPGGTNNRRPDRAVIAYSNLIRRHFKNTVPIVLGGIEASLRRVTHYDYWSNTLRRPILFDAKATYLLYGMAEYSVVELAKCLQNGEDPSRLRGLSFISAPPPTDYLQLPAHEETVSDKRAFIELFHMFYQNNDPVSARGLYERVGDRYLVQNPPAPYPDQAGLDAIYAQRYELDQHPYYARQGDVRALETIRFAISTHRGCYGECNFCAIAVHEGRTVRWRSEQSILEEAERIAAHPEFKGYIQDVGGPTANMYGFECSKKLKLGSCPDRRCLYPDICPALKIDHSRQLSMLRKIRKIPGVKKAFVASGIRYDMVLKDKAHGREYLKEIVDFHVSGQLKVAPEHTVDSVLERMGKPGARSLLEFKKMYDDLNREAGRNQFLTYYLIAAYPGCTDAEMQQLRQFAGEKLHIHPEQVQIFTPTPSTYGSLMYYAEMDPFTLEPLFIEKDPVRKERQKQIVVEKSQNRSKRR